MQTAAPGFQGSLPGIGSTPLQLTGNNNPLNTGVTVRALAANSTNKVYVGEVTATAVQIAAATAWAINTNYTVGNIVSNGGTLFICTVAGESASSGGPLGTGPAAIVDNAATWQFLSIKAVSASNGYELNSSESHLFQCPNASVLYVVGSTTGLAVCFDAS